MRKWLHPMRAAKVAYSEKLNPWMVPVAGWAAAIRGARMAIDDSNPFVPTEKAAGHAISQLLDGYRQWRDTASEELFKAIYGNLKK